MPPATDPVLERTLLRLLKPVSRSFYLSIRFLPPRIRPTLATAYLLARASDTVADANGTAVATRVETLARFPDGFSPAPAPQLRELVDEVLRHQTPGPERALLAALPEVYAAARALPQAHQPLVAGVLEQILKGQTLDLVRFEGQTATKALATAAELDEYTYLVAGCVGEFWTRLCFLEWPGYARTAQPEMLRRAKRFGQGLQLVNILRDFPADLRHGRCYLPIPDPERLVRHPELAHPIYAAWLSRARAHLAEAWRYTGDVRPVRVRFSCALPALLGARTLQRLRAMTPGVAGVKVGRAEVYRLVLWSLLAALAGPIHRRLRKTEFDAGERF